MDEKSGCVILLIGFLIILLLGAVNVLVIMGISVFLDPQLGSQFWFRIAAVAAALVFAAWEAHWILNRITLT